MSKSKTNPDFLNGVPELLILNLLARKPMHGYELVQSLKQRTSDTMSFGEGCIYPILHRLEAEKILSSRTETAGARQRVVYHVTAAGRKRLAEKSSLWRKIVKTITDELEGGEDVAVKLA